MYLDAYAFLPLGQRTSIQLEGNALIIERSAVQTILHRIVREKIELVADIGYPVIEASVLLNKTDATNQILHTSFSLPTDSVSTLEAGMALGLETVVDGMIIRMRSLRVKEIEIDDTVYKLQLTYPESISSTHRRGAFRAQVPHGVTICVELYDSTMLCEDGRFDSEPLSVARLLDLSRDGLGFKIPDGDAKEVLACKRLAVKVSAEELSDLKPLLGRVKHHNPLKDGKSVRMGFEFEPNQADALGIIGRYSVRIQLLAKNRLQFTA